MPGYDTAGAFVVVPVWRGDYRHVPAIEFRDLPTAMAFANLLRLDGIRVVVRQDDEVFRAGLVPVGGGSSVLFHVQ